MFEFSAESLGKLAGCDDLLQRVFNEVIRHYDCTVIEGARTVEAERANIAKGTSKLVDPLQCKHVVSDAFPRARAVDVAPSPLDWKDAERFHVFGGFVKGVAAMMEIPIRWGGDWDGDWDFHDQKFNDLVHFELA